MMMVHTSQNPGGGEARQRGRDRVNTSQMGSSQNSEVPSSTGLVTAITVRPHSVNPHLEPAFIYEKFILEPWLVWLSGVSAGLQTQRSLVQFPVRAHAWVVGRVPIWGHARDNQLMLSLTHQCFSPLLFSSFASLSKINK